MNVDRANLDNMVQTLVKLIFQLLCYTIYIELNKVQIITAQANKTGEPFVYWIYYAGNGAILANDDIPIVQILLELKKKAISDE